MDLIEWLEAMGNRKIVELLGVSVETIYQWKRADTSPKVMMAHKIVTLSNGLVDWEGVYAPYVIRRTEDPKQIKLNLTR